MTPKRSALDETRSTLREIIDRGEEVVSVFVEELTGSASLREELEKTVRRATRARKTVDRNLEALLGALNLPTRRDYAKLLAEIHSLQGAIVNLNMKMDRLIAVSSRVAEPAPPMLGESPRGAASSSGPSPLPAGAAKRRPKPAATAVPATPGGGRGKKRTAKKRTAKKRAARKRA
jgi:hypothetical protein